MTKKTCAIVVTFNRLELLKLCIDALLNQTSSISHIVIINNNSTDGTRKYLNSLENKKFIIHSMTENVGGAGGFKAGIQTAMEETDDFNFWLLDDDTIVAKDANEKFIKHSEFLKNNFGFLISNVRWTDGSPANVMQSSENWPEFAFQGLIKVNYGSFVSFFVNRENVVKVGVPISEFFIWGDDAEYSLRLRKISNGYFMNDVIAEHRSATNNVAPGILVDSPDRIDRYYYYYRNQMYIYREYYPSEFLKIWIINLVKALLIPFRVKDNRIKRCFVTLKGLFAALKFNPQITKIE